MLGNGGDYLDNIPDFLTAVSQFTDDLVGFFGTLNGIGGDLRASLELPEISLMLALISSVPVATVWTF